MLIGLSNRSYVTTLLTLTSALKWNSYTTSPRTYHTGEIPHSGAVDSLWKARFNSSWIWYFIDHPLSYPPLTVYQGATPAQARAALKRYSDVMEAAERIFDGAFDHITDDAATTSASSAGPIREPERCRAPMRLVVCPLSRALSESSYTAIDSRGGRQRF